MENRLQHRQNNKILLANKPSNYFGMLAVGKQQDAQN